MQESVCSGLKVAWLSLFWLFLPLGDGFERNFRKLCKSESKE